MKQTEVRFDEDFAVLIENERAQAAVMTLQPNDATGGPGNLHEDADQWLFVVSGAGSAIVDDTEIPLRQGTLLLIERGETHEIRSGDGEPLRTLNLYVPPAY